MLNEKSVFYLPANQQAGHLRSEKKYILYNVMQEDASIYCKVYIKFFLCFNDDIYINLLYTFYVIKMVLCM